MSILRYLAVSALFSIGAMCGSAQDFAKGVAANNSGDYQTALEQWLPLAQQGDVNAQTMLGFAYKHGDVFPQDFAEAAKWFRLAAQHGLAEAQARLGVLYFQGEGVELDYSEAVRWFRSAALQGHAQAQSFLSGMYALGLGVSLDRVKALMWMEIASVNDQKVAEIRDELAAKMTQKETSLAQKMARKCLESQYVDCDEPQTAYVLSRSDEALAILRDKFLIGEIDIEPYNLPFLEVLNYEEIYARALKPDETGQWLSAALEGRGDSTRVDEIVQVKAEEYSRIGNGEWQSGHHPVWVPSKYKEDVLNEPRDTAIMRQIFRGVMFVTGDRLPVFAITFLSGANFDQELARNRAHLVKFSQAEPFMAMILRLIGMALIALPLIAGLSQTLVWLFRRKRGTIS